MTLTVIQLFGFELK